MNKSKKSEFLLVFRQPQDEPDPTPEEMEKILSRWMDWMKSMNSRGEMRGVNRLQDTGKVLRGVRGAKVTDGPFVESKEVVGGYILIAADDLAQATEIARGCPGLDRNTIVEIRPVEPLPSV
jgi:hypothetical protein